MGPKEKLLNANPVCQEEKSRDKDQTLFPLLLLFL